MNRALLTWNEPSLGSTAASKPTRRFHNLRLWLFPGGAAIIYVAAHLSRGNFFMLAFWGIILTAHYMWKRRKRLPRYTIYDWGISQRHAHREQRSCWDEIASYEIEPLLDAPNTLKLCLRSQPNVSWHSREVVVDTSIVNVPQLLELLRTHLPGKRVFNSRSFS